MGKLATLLVTADDSRGAITACACQLYPTTVSWMQFFIPKILNKSSCTAHPFQYGVFTSLHPNLLSVHHWLLPLAG